MSDIKNVFDIAGRSMAAQMVRLNTVASNIANAEARAGSVEDAYRPLRSACTSRVILSRMKRASSTSRPSM